MAWTYNEELPTAKDKVRLLCGDTNLNDKLIANEEIAFALGKNSNEFYAAATVCRMIAGKLRRRPSLTPTPGGIALDSQAQASGFMELATQLEEQGKLDGVAGFGAGGISIEGKLAVENDDDRVRPAFRINEHRSVGSGATGWAGWSLDERDG